MAGWLCPTERDRARVLDMSDRIKRARAVSVGAIGVGILATAPWSGWWTLLLFGVAVLTISTLDWRMARTDRPERVVAINLVTISVILAVAAALTGGPHSPALAWLVVPAAMTAIRFRSRVVVAGAVVTACEMVVVSLTADTSALAADPRFLMVSLGLLISVVAVTSALSGAEMQYREESVLDPLTGLLNRSGLESRFEEVREQAALLDKPVCLVTCDLDRFKRINDTYGHDRGDQVLRDATYEMRKALRSFELFYRLGGEEFVVLLPGMDAEGGVAVAERLRAAVECAQPAGMEVTLSLGVAARTGEAVHYDDLYQRADRALYAAKAAGRNRVAVAGDPAPTVLVPPAPEPPRLSRA
ncbi:MAG TPA: diguanylate cyclase [Solirubrobacteraceae bacterium]|nr:diguanylate cyclase [Solirubrobacteraceae bacterium]